MENLLPPPTVPEGLAKLEFGHSALPHRAEATMRHVGVLPKLPDPEILHSSPPPPLKTTPGAYRYSPPRASLPPTPDISASITRNDLTIFIQIKGQKTDTPLDFMVRDRTSKSKTSQATLFPNPDGFCALTLKNFFDSFKESDTQELECVFHLLHKDFIIPLSDLSNQNILSIESDFSSCDFVCFIESKLCLFTLPLIGASEDDLRSYELWVFHPHCTSPYAVQSLTQSEGAITINALPGSTVGLRNKTTGEIVTTHPLNRFHLTRSPGIFFDPTKEPAIKLGSLFPICTLRIQCAVPKDASRSLLDRKISFTHITQTGERTEFGSTALAYLQAPPTEFGIFTSSKLAERGSVFTIELNNIPLQKITLPPNVEKLLHTLTLQIDKSGEATIINSESKVTTA